LPRASASAARLLAYMASTVLSSMSRTFSDRISSAGRKSIVHGLKSREAASNRRRPRVM
jgi:hypothetical protein